MGVLIDAIPEMDKELRHPDVLLWIQHEEGRVRSRTWIIWLSSNHQ